jgi:hypothetical protein
MTASGVTGIDFAWLDQKDEDHKLENSILS